MPKTDRRVRRSQQGAEDPRQLLARILDTPHPERAVPRLPPLVLHRLIQDCGLEDCAELVALATPEQLSAVFDLDLWRRARPGMDEELDPDRFAVWLDVLLESGAALAAHKLAEIDAALVIAALTEYVRVFDPGVAEGDVFVAAALKDAIYSEVGGYVVMAKRMDSWDTMNGVLVALDAEHSDRFHQVMRGCRRLSNSEPEIDGLDDLLTDGEQAQFDLALDREQRREKLGYVAAAQARAFLQSSRQVRVEPHAAPHPNPLAIAHAPGRLAHIHALMEFVREHDPAAYSLRSEELAFLGNVMVSGCSVQGRPFTTREALDAAVATCNLGLENWPLETAQTLPEDLLANHELGKIFQVGWTVLHNDVCMFVAEQLLSILGVLDCSDRETRLGLHKLRRELTRFAGAGEPWHARAALEVIAMLDMPAWAALLGLIAPCPVMLANVSASGPSRPHSVSPEVFDFVSENRHIAAVRAFMQSLPDALSR